MAKSSHIPAKIIPPRLPQIVHRTRLYDQIENGHKNIPIMWVSGAAGMGKTTLAAGYLQNRNLRHVWYQLDAGDADPGTFFHYLGQLCRQAAPRFRQPLPQLTPEYLPGLPVFGRRYIEKVFHRLKKPIVFVLDNYHEVSPDSMFHEVLKQGLEVLPADVKILVLSRGDIPPEWASLRASQQMASLSEQDVQFTTQEGNALVDFLAKSKHTTPSLNKKQRIQQQAKGWAAGVVLLMEGQLQGLESQQTEQSQTPQVIFDYLAQEIWSQCSQAMRELTQQLAWMPSVTSAEAQSLTRIPQAEEMLEDLCRRRFFTERQGGVERTYRFHPLFQAFLQNRIVTVRGQEALRLVQTESATLLGNRGEVEAAVDLLQMACGYAEATQLIVRTAPSFLEQGRFLALRHMIQQMPREFLSEYPWLLYFLGWAILPHSSPDSQSHFHQAFELFIEKSEFKGALLSCSGILRTMLMSRVDQQEMDPWFDTLERLFTGHISDIDREIEAEITGDMLNYSLWRARSREKISYWNARTWDLLEDLPNDQKRIRFGFYIHVYETWWGNLSAAQSILECIRRWVKRSVAPPEILLLWHHAETLEANFYEKGSTCHQHIEKGLELVRREGLDFWAGQFLFGGIMVALQKRDHVLADQYLSLQKQEAEKAIGGKGSQYLYYQCGAFVRLFQGDVQQAHWFIQKMEDLSFDWGFIPHLFALTLSTQIHHLRHDHVQARRSLEEAYSINAKIQSYPFDLWLGLVEAQMMLDSQNPVLAKEKLCETLQQSKKNMMPCLYCVNRSFVAPLLAVAIQENIELAYVTELIRTNHVPLPDEMKFLQAWPWPVKIRTLGTFEIEAQGKPIQFGRKVPRRVLALLQAIIAFGGENVREDQLLDTLWPEADGDRAYRSYATALHRLRKILGDEKAIIVKDRKVTLDPYLCWVDAWAFEHLCKRVKDVNHEKDLEKAQQLSEQARELYRAPFLEEAVESPWAEPYRQRLKTLLSQLPAEFEQQQERSA